MSLLKSLYTLLGNRSQLPKAPPAQPISPVAHYEDGSSSVGELRTPSPYQQYLPSRQMRPLQGGELQGGGGLRMYEDQSFSGNPAAFRAMNPQYRFYEDNTFSPPPLLQGGATNNALSILLNSLRR